MFDFHYNQIKDRYAKKIKLLFTDGLVYEIKGNDVYKHFYKNKDMFDFSEYPKKSKFYDAINKKAITKMKDETKEIPITQSGRLRTEMY